MSTAKRVLVAIVASLLMAACGGGGGEGNGGTAGQDGDAAVRVTAGDLFFDPEQLTASPGEVTFELDNQGEAVHNVVIEEAGDRKVVEAQGGNSETGTIELEAGTYTFYCDIPGHRQAGMEGTLTVGS